MMDNSKITCIVVGEGNLAQRCMGILKEYDISIQSLVSGDEWLYDANSLESFPKYRNLSDLSVFEPVDYIFSINNSLILKKSFTSLAKIMAINYHDAPLPRYAGMYATNWAILNGETEHGISWHEVVDEIDAGDIVACQTVPVLPNDTALSLNTRCFEAALKCFGELMVSIVENKLNPVAQNLNSRTYYPLGARPDAFGLITHDMDAKSVDRLTRATNFTRHYANEFANPLIYIRHEYYIVPRTTVVFDETGIPGYIVDFKEKRGFYCLDGLVVPDVIFDKNGYRVNINQLLELGEQLIIPNKSLTNKALFRFEKMARFEPYWKKQLSQMEILGWPIITGIPSSEILKSSLSEHLLDQLGNLFPEHQIEDVIFSVWMLYFIRISGQLSGTLGFISTELSKLEEGLESFFSSWLPLNGTIDDSNSVNVEIKKVLTTITKIEKTGIFVRTTRIRYPELRKNSTDFPTVILSKGSLNDQLQNNKSLTIYFENNELIYSLPSDSNYSGLNTIAESFEMFLQNLVETPEVSVNQLGLVSVKKSEKIIESINHPSCEPVIVQDVIDSFMQASPEFSDKTAVFDSGVSYSYSSFAKDIENLSAQIGAQGILPGQIVAVIIGRNYNYFVSIMAILRCGACFLPIDPTMPSERKLFFCSDSKTSLILTDDSNFELIENIQVLNVGIALKTPAGRQLPTISYDPDSFAYIIYTSGSTGVPKGVLISRRALANFISGALGLYQITSYDCVLQFSSLAFDASIEEIFTSFCTGASLYLRTAEMLLADELLSFSIQHQISVWDLPTAFWRQVIQSEKYINDALPEKLRIVIIGGEAVSTNDVILWNKREPNHKLFNTYGPTETTVVALAYEIKYGYIPATTVPIGQPLPGYKLYITDNNRKIVPEGVSGELLVAGDSLALGYLNREPEQSRAFISFLTPDNGLQRCYCTGDLVTAGNDGLIYYLGRADSQVKIRGYRVEPGEIESQIGSMDGVETCVVAVYTNPSGEKSLYAFYTEKDISTNPLAIKDELKKVLPAYMVPEMILKVDKIPLTSNGKIDKKSLIASAKEKLSQTTHESVEPTNDTEAFVLDIWKKVLSVEAVGIDDDFFDMGGHSLKAVQLMAEIKKLKGINIPLASLISNSTVRTFAPLLVSKTKDELWHCLVPIRPNGTKTPLFLIHGAGLNILLYQSLTYHLKQDRPIYAFQAKGLDGKSDLAGSIEEMADDYIEEIKKILPQGPYMLLGFSLGGFIAYDMAKKLTNEGNKVIFTGVIDSFTSIARHIQSPVKSMLFNFRSALIKPFYVLWLLLLAPWSEKRQLFLNKYKSLRFTLIYNLIKLGLMKEKERKIIIDDGVPMFLSENVEIVMSEALYKYQLVPSSIKLDLFKAGKPTFYIPNRKDYGWNRFAGKGVIVHTLPTEHSRIFAPPNDKLFAEILDQRIVEVEAELKNQK